MDFKSISYEVLFHQANFATAIVDSEGKILERNVYFQKVFPENFSDLKEYIPADLHFALSKLFAETAMGEKGELEVINRFGQEFQNSFRIEINPLKAEESTIFLAVISDISRYKKTENILIQASSEWRHIFDSILNPICLTNSQGQIARGNTAFSRMVQKNFLEIVGENFLDLFPDLANIQKEFLSSQPNLSWIEYEFNWNGQDYRITIDPYNEIEKGVGIIYIFENITQQKKIEKELSEAEFRLSEIIDSMVNPVYYKNSKNLYTGCNRAFCEFLGLPREKIISSSTQDLILPEIAQIYENKDMELLKDGGKQVYESCLRHADGTFHDVMFHKSLILSRENLPQGIVGVIIDITDRKKAEILVRTSLQEKEVLLKEIHHRVKNNLNIISSLLNLKRNEVKNIETWEVLSESISRIQSMALIHERLYRSDDLSNIKISDYVKNLSSALLSNYNIEFPIDIKIGCDDIFLGINQMIPVGLMLNEMITNSIKYAFKDKKLGTISIAVLQSSPAWVEISYSDDGPGIPGSVDLENPKTLGVQIIKDLTRQLDGTVELVREKGAFYKIRFPFQQNSA
jgi:PAS domain S-box-containing protein